ncbi:hypothetical protein JCM10450v2_006275 [Rhodotorula kratochvilovae]
MGIALWLSPSSPTVSSDLQGLISSLASKHSTPRFGPHVTLLSGISSSAALPPLLASLRAALAAWRALHEPPLQLAFADLGSKAADGNFFQYLFARVDPANETLLALRKAVRETLLPEKQGTEDDYFPHLSLMYGTDDGARTAEGIIGELQREGGEVASTEGGCSVRGHAGIEVGEVQVWMCEGRPEEWRLVGREAL